VPAATAAGASNRDRALGGRARRRGVPVAAAEPPATPDPIPERIARSGVAVELVDVARIPPSSDAPPAARLDFLTHAGDGSGRLFVVDMRGLVYVLRAGAPPAVFLDIRRARPDHFRDDSREKGAKTIAFHPDFARRGARGEGRLYTVHSERAADNPAEPGVVTLAAEPDRPAHDHIDVVTEWRVDPRARERVDPATRRIVLRVAMPGIGHNVGQLAFDPTAPPGGDGHGLLHIGIGDGTYHPSHDFAQSLAAPLGKILRIDPLPTQDGRPYRVPADNPFVGRPGALPEIWALGLRNQQRFAWGDGGTMLIADIGEDHVEEINRGRAGANYGWPLREGRFVLDRNNPETLYALPGDDARHGFDYPLAQYDHDEGRAIVGGYVYRGRHAPALAGHYVFGDLMLGRLFHIPFAVLARGGPATIVELTPTRNGRPIHLLELLGDAPRADLRFGRGEDGEIYVLTKYDGMIRRFAAVPRR